MLASPRRSFLTVSRGSFPTQSRRTLFPFRVSALGTLPPESCISGMAVPSRKERMKVKSLSRVRLFATPWTVAYQASPSRGFSRQEYRGCLPVPSPGDLPDPGIEPRSLALQADTLPAEPPGKPSLKDSLNQFQGAPCPVSDLHESWFCFTLSRVLDRLL